LAVKVIENGNPYLNNLKLRLGWGVTGQQDIGDYYAYLANYQLGFDNAQYQFGDEFINTLRPNGYDINIKWEESTTYNFGADLSILKDKLTASFDLYQKNTRDLLNYIPVPAGTNLTNFITTNVGNMETRGTELSLNAINVGTKNLLLDFGINFSYNKSEITKLLASTDSTYQGVLVGGIAGGVGSNIQIHSIGYAPYSFYVYEQKYDEEGKMIEGEFTDKNDDGLINSSDRYRFENPAPDYTIGFTSNLRFYDFEFSFAGRINIGNYVYNNIQTSAGSVQYMYHSTNYLGNITQSALDLNAKVQSNLTYSDHFVKNASFLKIDHITLSYNFMIFKNKSLKLYATAQNPFVFTKYDGLDPEIGNGIERDFYPRARTYVFGLNANF
jgi:iron complex outermembrane receptor protein